MPEGGPNDVTRCPADHAHVAGSGGWWSVIGPPVYPAIGSRAHKPPFYVWLAVTLAGVVAALAVGRAAGPRPAGR